MARKIRRGFPAATTTSAYVEYADIDLRHMGAFIAAIENTGSHELQWKVVGYPSYYGDVGNTIFDDVAVAASGISTEEQSPCPYERVKIYVKHTATATTFKINFSKKK